MPLHTVQLSVLALLSIGLGSTCQALGQISHCGASCWTPSKAPGITTAPVTTLARLSSYGKLPISVVLVCLLPFSILGFMCRRMIRPWGSSAVGCVAVHIAKLDDSGLVYTGYFVIKHCSFMLFTLLLSFVLNCFIMQSPSKSHYCPTHSKQFYSGKAQTRPKWQFRVLQPKSIRLWSFSILMPE